MRRGRASIAWGLVLSGVLAGTNVAEAQVLKASEPDDAVLLPDGRPLPPLPVHLEGAWTRDQFRVVSWRADLAVEGDAFAGRVSVGEFEQFAPLTVQGTRNGNVVEFSVRLNEKEVSHFAGNVAGTSVVGVIDTPDGKGIEWAGSWVGDSVISQGMTEPSE